MIQISPKTKKVSFVLSGVSAQKVFLVGDFNDWDKTGHPMKKTKNNWKAEIKLPSGEYKFKYLADGNWINDPSAHKYIPNVYGGEDSVVVVTGMAKTTKGEK
jgi:1,4-alpha-glucan branching enzyme